MQNNKGFAIVEIILSGVLIVIALFFIWVVNNRSAKDTDTTSPNQLAQNGTPTLTPISTPSVTNDTYADWKKYENTTHSYSFLYPKDWKVEIAGYSKWEPEGFPYVSKNDDSYQSVIFSYSKDEEANVFDPGEREKVTINNLTAYVDKDVFGGDSLDDWYTIQIGDGEYITAIFPVSDPNQSIAITRSSPEVKIAEQIVKSFSVIH